MPSREPFAEFDLPADPKPVVTFLRRPPDGKAPVFMALLEKTFGKEITTRTFETVRRCSAA